MDESRKQFEEWAIKSGHNISMDARGRYVFSYTATAWAGWQASRAAIEIELPMKKAEHASHQSAFNGGIDASAKAIRAAGIKVKE